MRVAEAMRAGARPFLVRDANMRKLLQYLGLAALVAGLVLVFLFFYAAANAEDGGGPGTPPFTVVALSLPLFLLGGAATFFARWRRRS